MRTTVHTQAWRNPRVALETAPCEDESSDICAVNRSQGLCEFLPQRMRAECPATCNVCPWDAKHPCHRPNATALASTAHDIGATLERMQSHVSFAKFEPTWLSRDPPIVRLKRFVDAVDARRLIGLCEPRLTPSTFGAPRRSAGRDSKRVSSTCMCNWKECMEDAAVRRLLRRVREVTNSPKVNAESLQLVHYKAGGYFKSHLDTSAMPHTPQGARLYSVLIYLQAPTGGGATRFVDAGVRVSPKLGTAVVFTSLCDADPSIPELRSHHEGELVSQGDKWVAQVWVHQYSMEPVSLGCPLAKPSPYSREYWHRSLSAYHSARAAAGFGGPPSCTHEEAAHLCANASYCCLVKDVARAAQGQRPLSPPSWPAQRSGVAAAHPRRASSKAAEEPKGTRRKTQTKEERVRVGGVKAVTKATNKDGVSKARAAARGTRAQEPGQEPPGAEQEETVAEEPKQEEALAEEPELEKALAEEPKQEVAVAEEATQACHPRPKLATQARHPST